MRVFGILAMTMMLALSIVYPAQAQLTEHEDYYLTKSHWGVGLQAGLLSGSGISIRFHPHTRYGFELNAGAWKGGDNLIASFGAEAQYDFDWSGRNRFYGFVGLGYYQNGKDDPDDLKGPFRAGFGAGYDWDISSAVIFSAELGVTWFTDGIILPLPQIGISYLFN
jgi:hypothetical protein